MLGSCRQGVLVLIPGPAHVERGRVRGKERRTRVTEKARTSGLADREEGLGRSGGRNVRRHAWRRRGVWTHVFVQTFGC
jgi:hypothetical protein